MFEVIEKAKDLGLAIRHSEVYERFQNAQAAMENDPTASELVAEYKKKQKELYELQTTENVKMSALDQVVKDLRRMGNAVNQNEVISEFLSAQKAFSDLMNQVNQVLRYFVTGEGATSKGTKADQ
jgi:cell fate (sporulation/competence/biofilm development) regulator YlbF (YheA/YmcA/DUF963 family)